MHAKRSLRYISRTIMGSYHTLYFWETCFFIFMLFYFCSFELGIIEAGTIRNTNPKIKNSFEDAGYSAWTTEIDSTDHILIFQPKLLL